MALSENDIALIEKHLDGDLSEDERILFNERVTDADFSDELALQQQVINSLQAFHREQLKTELKSHLNNARGKSETNKNKISQFKTGYAVAAVVSFILLSTIVIYLNTNHRSAESLYTSYYSPYPISATTRGEDNKVDVPAFAAYEEGHYSKAVVLIQPLLKQDGEAHNKTILQLMLGNCYLNLNQRDEAIVNFKAVINSPDAILSQTGKWYYALTLLKLGKTDECRIALDELITTHSVYSTQVQKLGKELDDMR